MYDPQLNERKGEFDWPLLLSAGGLMCIGTAFIYSALAGHQSALPWYKQMYAHQILWYVFGLGAAVAMLAIEYGRLARWAGLFYWLAILLLGAVFLVGSTVNGAKRWILGVQPSEFAKIAFILLLANVLSCPAKELRRPRVFFAVLGFTLLPFVLILKEPDLGSALVLLPTGLVMMLVAGTPKRFLIRLVGIVGLLATLFVVDVFFLPTGWWQIPMQPYQRDRLAIYFGCDYTHFAPPNATPAELQRLRQKELDDAYNVRQALISVGSGGLFGKGWRQGTQNALGYLPRAVAHNDFIFSVIAEEEGFVGSVIVITLYAVVLFTGLRIAGSARDRLGKLVAVGVVTLIFSHVFINIGMNIRIMPVTGVPLPLLSYGGSSVLCSLIAVGLMQNIHIHRRGY